MYEYFFIGLVAGFIFYELTDVSPGGVIAPAYFAMFINQPNKILMTVIMALAVWFILKLLSERLIIYGRRRFLLAIILGFCIKVAIDNYLQPVSLLKFDLQSIGYIIPGLIANEMSRQKVLPTLAGLGIVTTITYLLILLLG
ncbi:MAG: poly-gamma-glutamate biosynthesis protein PgsC [Candidatus Zixiibacteriota bacterium]